MSNNARLTDIAMGICCCHPPIPCIPMVGTIITASPNVSTNSLGQARLTDLVLGACGHIGLIVSGSPNVQVNNLALARVSDAVAGCLIMTIATGSPNVQTN
ncbi:MAG: PAAR domain-containing protein [Conexivisphaerales archaeon]